jgi:hypothetical protein
MFDPKNPIIGEINAGLELAAMYLSRVTALMKDVTVAKTQEYPYQCSLCLHMTSDAVCVCGSESCGVHCCTRRVCHDCLRKIRTYSDWMKK